MNQLTHIQIIDLADNMLINCQRHSLETYFLASILHATGSRCGDVLRNPEFTPNNINNNIIYSQEKTQVPRVLTPQDYSPISEDDINTYITLSRNVSYNVHLRNIKLSHGYNSLNTGTKDIGLHFFRHAYATKLHLQGNTITEISQKLGLSRVTEAYTYVHAPIYTL